MPRTFSQTLKEDWRELWVLALFVLLSPVMELLNRPIGQVRDLSLALDEAIPFIPQFILTYHSWMPSLILLGFYFFYKDRPRYYSYSLALLVGQGLAHLTYPFFQTVVTRHPFTVPPQNFFEELVHWTYQVDNNYCGFPSIHVLCCAVALVKIAGSKMKPVPKNLLMAHFILIIISTVFVKQHVFLDLPGGFLYAAFGLLTLPLAARLYLKSLR